MKVKTEIGKTYAVTCPYDCLVSDADLQTIISVTAGTQAYFVATTEEVIVPDTAKVTPFKGALGLAASAGGGGGGGGITVDQTYSATSTNPQSGVAVAEAVDGIFTAAQRSYLDTLFNNTYAPNSTGNLQTDDDVSRYVESHTTQKVDLGELSGEVVAIGILNSTSPYRWVIFKSTDGGYPDPLVTQEDARVFPDIQIFFRTGATLPVLTWDTGGTDIHWLNTDGRNVAPTPEPNTSYHLGVSYEFGHYVVSVTYEESTLEEEASNE